MSELIKADCEDYLRLLRIEQCAREVVNAQLALETPAFLKALESLRTALEAQA